MCCAPGSAKRARAQRDECRRRPCMQRIWRDPRRARARADAATQRARRVHARRGKRAGVGEGVQAFVAGGVPWCTGHAWWLRATGRHAPRRCCAHRARAKRWRAGVRRSRQLPPMAHRRRRSAWWTKRSRWRRQHLTPHWPPPRTRRRCDDSCRAVRRLPVRARRLPARGFRGCDGG